MWACRHSMEFKPPFHRRACLEQLGCCSLTLNYMFKAHCELNCCIWLMADVGYSCHPYADHSSSVGRVWAWHLEEDRAGAHSRQSCADTPWHRLWWAGFPSSLWSYSMSSPAASFSPTKQLWFLYLTLPHPNITHPVIASSNSPFS